MQNINDINNNQLNEDIDKLINEDNLYNNKIYEIYWIYKQMTNFEKKENKKEEEKKNILKDKEKEEKNKIKEIENKDGIIYKIDKYKYKVDIFGKKFVDNNNDNKIEIVYKNKIYKLREYLYLEVEKEEDNNLDY